MLLRRAIYVVDRGYVALAFKGAFFVTRAKSNIDAHRVYSAPTDRSTGINQTISLDGFYTRQDYPEPAHPPRTPRPGLHHQQLLASGSPAVSSSTFPADALPDEVLAIDVALRPRRMQRFAAALLAAANPSITPPAA